MDRTPTTDQLRNRIDSGVTGEKVGHPDPAAAPLGTDAEAAGAPPTKQERQMEARALNLHREKLPVNGVPIYLGLIALIGTYLLVVGTLA